MCLIPPQLIAVELLTISLSLTLAREDDLRIAPIFLCILIDVACMDVCIGKDILFESDAKDY